MAAWPKAHARSIKCFRGTGPNILMIAFPATPLIQTAGILTRHAASKGVLAGLYWTGRTRAALSLTRRQAAAHASGPTPTMM
jgi:hypothetical protein